MTVSTSEINVTLAKTYNTTAGLETENAVDDLTALLYSGGEALSTASALEEPVAASEEGLFWGGQHVVGGDGGTYDVQGEAGKVYDLLSDTGLDFRGQFESWGDDGLTVIGETGLTVGEGLGSDYINFRKDGSARINGQLMEAGLIYDLADGGTAILENGQLTVTTAEGYTICQQADGSSIDFDVTTGENGVDNGQLPGGLLGQTFDADDTARDGAIDGDVADYVCKALDPLNDNRGDTNQATNESQLLIEKLQGLIKQSLGLLSLYGASVEAMESFTEAMESLVDTDSSDTENKYYADVDLDSSEEDEINAEDDEAAIHGGSGNDTAVFSGSKSHYTVTQEGEYIVYTDSNGRSVKIANDVETVDFES